MTARPTPAAPPVAARQRRWPNRSEPVEYRSRRERWVHISLVWFVTLVVPLSLLYRADLNGLEFIGVMAICHFAMDRGWQLWQRRRGAAGRTQDT